MLSLRARRLVAKGMYSDACVPTPEPLCRNKKESDGGATLSGEE